MMQIKNIRIKKKDCGEEGMSVMELVAVLLLIAIILAFALPAVSNSIDAYNVRSAGDHIAQRLTAARTLAMTKNKQVTISFNRLSGLYGYDFTPVDAPDGLPDTQDPDDTSTTYLIEAPSGNTRLVFPGDNNIMVTFNSRGELPIGTTDQAVRVTNSSRTATVHVNLRGKVWVTMP